MTIKEVKINLKQIIKHDHLSVMLWGPPGIGKSDAVKQVADELDHEFIDIRLSMLMPSDLMGLPYPNKEHTKANWLYPSLFPPPDSKGKFIILLDEISNAAMSVQNAAYRLVLDKSLGDHYSLPPGAKIIAAGNREEDNSGVQKFSAALSNRFIHFDIQADFESWKDWALKSEINEKVIGFLNFKSDMLYKSPNIEMKAYPTPRTWEMVSKLLSFNIPNEEVIIGTVGEGASGEFMSYIEVYDKLPDIAKILKGIKVAIPKEPSVQYALSSSLVSRSNKENIHHIFNFCKNFSEELHLLTIRDIIRKDEETVMAYSGFDKWYSKYGEFFEEDKK